MTESASRIAVNVLEKAPSPLGAYSHAMWAGDLLFVSGQGARDAETGKEAGVELDAQGNVLSYDIEVQTRAVLKNLAVVLEAAGCTMEDLVDVSTFLKDMKDFSTYNRVYSEIFSFKNPPARTTVQVASLPGKNFIEIKAIAYKKEIRREINMTVEVHTKTQHLDHFIGGEYVPSCSGQTFDTINPATGEVIATVSLGTAEDINRAVVAADEAFRNGPWPRMSMQERCNILNKIGRLILDRRAQLAKAETLDTGKPISESMDGDIPRAALNFQFFANFAQSAAEESFSSLENERHLSVREPLGVCGLITPWNLPLYLATWKIAPCLVMGNTCVLKPAEWTPYTAFLLGELVNDAGLPKGVLNIVQGFGADGAGEALTRHPLVRSISFTGETSTGKAIMSAAAATLKKVSFELGGKGANIIFADADLNEAVPTAVRAAFRNQGEICLAGSRLFVEQKILPQVIEQMVERVRKIKVGDPLDTTTQMGALISKEHLAKVESYIKIGKTEGRLLTGGERLREFPEGNFLSPALFTDLPYDSRFCQEEIFGPALPIIPFQSEEEVLHMANSTAYGLSASMWSQDVDRCHRVSRALKTGLVWVNCWFARDLRTPFGGQKSSGIGREGGRYSLEFFSESKTISYKYKG